MRFSFPPGTDKRLYVQRLSLLGKATIRESSSVLAD